MTGATALYGIGSVVVSLMAAPKYRGQECSGDTF